MRQLVDAVMNCKLGVAIGKASPLSAS